MAKMSRDEAVLAMDKALLLAGVAPMLLNAIKSLIDTIKGDSISEEIDREEMNSTIDRLILRQTRIDAA